MAQTATELARTELHITATMLLHLLVLLIGSDLIHLATGDRSLQSLVAQNLKFGQNRLNNKGYIVVVVFVVLVLFLFFMQKPSFNLVQMRSLIAEICCCC